MNEETHNVRAATGNTSVAARYYSHVLYFPDRKPFDNWDSRWPSFIGEFIAPLVGNRPELLYWFSNYGSFARFRVFTDNYESLRPELEKLRDDLGLVDKGEEKALTLEEDLASSRMRGPDCKVPGRLRAAAILRSLKAVGDVLIESVIQRPDGYWEFEANGDASQNPICGHRFSLVHLYHNMMASDGIVYEFEGTKGVQGVLSYYYFHELQHRGEVSVTKSQAYRIQM